MTRSVWKGPYFDITLYKKIKKAKETDSKGQIKTWSRRSTIIPDFVGHGLRCVEQDILTAPGPPGLSPGASLGSLEVPD